MAVAPTNNIKNKNMETKTTTDNDIDMDKAQNHQIILYNVK